MAEKKVKVAINGFGRIGRLAFRLMHENPLFDIVAINDITDAETLAYLLKYDTTQGRYKSDSISFSGSDILVDDEKFHVYAEKDPSLLPWKELGVDVVLECTGIFTSKEKAELHLKAGAKKVVISAPAKGEGIETVVFGVNEGILDGSETVISAASCTTNCLAPVAKVLDDSFGIVKGFMTTVHSYTNDQITLDGPHKAGILSRRGRTAAQNIVPTSTGAAKAVGLVLPQLKGKMDGMALRVPTATGSVVDLVVELKKDVTKQEVNEAMKKAAEGSVVLGYTEDPIVSSDVIGMHYGSLFDSLLTNVMTVDGKQLVKVIAWYDNEMSFTSQMIRTLYYFVTRE
ncbi:MAG: type I glyceraldehyde-3-phosphate dehydrogenase [Bacillales bacterium]|nr:type I glyceraldehyde-3-phosphate dehydrogenase [Bacillales bacterium]